MGKERDGWGCGLVVKCLPTIWKALDSISRTTERKKKRVTQISYQLEQKPSSPTPRDYMQKGKAGGELAIERTQSLLNI